ncbi:MAG TPA: VWA domain-containing protein [Planctomycetaceae bacterium]|nr:VWA domain-containing protein [Planctomycetaceae bacterium]
MTSLRFVGDVPLWLGLLLAFIVCTLSWLYYSRESFDLPRRLKWFLPLLRSLAFFLGIMILTGPVLHHRTIIGELGRVKIYLDASRSMTMQDRHMSIGRKLLIAEQLGWITPGHVDATLLNLADEMAAARRELIDSMAIDQAGVRSPAFSKSRASAAFLTRLKSHPPQLPITITERLTAELLQPLETLAGAPDSDESNTEAAVTQLTALANICESIETDIRKSFDDSITDIVNSGDESIQSALAMFDETPRWRRAELELAESSAKVLTTLREKHDVEVLVLSGEEATIENSVGWASSPSRNSTENPAATSLPPLETFSNITDLSTGIVATQKGIAAAATTTESEPAAAPPKTAIVLITDGQHNSGPSPLQTARVLGNQGVAFFGVSVGATQQASDLAVVGVEYPDLVFQKDTVRGVMIIRDQVAAGRPFVAQIRYADEVLWEKQLVTQNTAERRIEFEFKIDELVTRIGAQFASDIKQHAVPLAFEASIAPLPEESETDNNQREIRLAAIVSSYKVMIIDGRSRWETRYLRNAFERDEQWSVNTIIAGAGTDDAVLRRGDQDGQFPATREALFQYDMIIFGEVEANLFSPQDFDWLREFVEIRGGGMVFIDGQRRTLLQLTETSLESLLPIEWVPEPITSKPTSMQLTEKGASESALRLVGDDQENRRFWTELPAPHTLVAVRALPGSEILVDVTVDGQPQPAIVTRAFGAGRVLYFAFDETWRWRYKVADMWHQRIWNQLAKYVMPRPFSVSDEYVSIDTGSVRYDFGSTVDVRVQLMGLDAKPAVGATADALVWKNGRIVSTISLNADADVPGIYRGRFGALPEGDYEVSVRASGYSESALKARSRFVVLPPESGEMTQTAANEPLLKQIAAASGGAFLREEDMSLLPELLSPLSTGRVIESDTLIWQSYWWFAAIILLLTVEWILRKRAGLL